MSNTLPALVPVQDEFATRLPVFRDVLAPFRIPVEAFRSGLVATLQMEPWLLNACTTQSLMNSAMTFAVQGLRCDRASQHGCIVPFKKQGTPIVMVRGYTVQASRAGYTLQARLVREGDHIREIGGSDPRIEHEPLIGSTERLIGVYAVARSRSHPTLFTPFLPLDHIMKVRDGSQGYRAAQRDGKQHPWDTHFEAMMLKTPKRLLSKDIPNDLLGKAAWLDSMHDIGRVAYLSPEGHGVIDGEATQIDQPAVFPPRADQPSDLLGPANPPAADGSDPAGQLIAAFRAAATKDALIAVWRASGPALSALESSNAAAHGEVLRAYDECMDAFNGKKRAA